MKQQNLHNKKFRETIHSMFNLKMFSLMKKHVFSLLMAFALVMGLSAGAWAQTDYADLEADPLGIIVGSPLNPRIYLAGATGSLSVTEVPNHTYTWRFYAGSDDTTPITLVDVGTDAMASGFDISATGTPTGLATQIGATANFTWTEAANGAFYATVTDEDDNTNCSTVRGFHMLVIGYQIIVYASDATGLQLEGAALVGCGDGTAYPAFMNNVAIDPDGDGDDIRTDIMNTATTPAPTDGSLSGVRGINPRTQRWYTAALIFDTPASGTLTQPTVGSARLDITIGGTNVTAIDVASINNENVFNDEALMSVTQTVIEPLVADPASVPTAVNGQNGLAADTHAHYYFPFELTINDRWGLNLGPQATVRNFRVYTNDDGSGVTLGQEPTADEGAENTSAEFTINGKPATSIITAN